MPKDFCLLLSGFSEADALDCSKHRHLSLREVKEREKAGEIAQYDVHPYKKNARYVVRVDPRVRTLSATGIPAGLMRRAAGASFPGATAEERSARKHIDAWDLIRESEHSQRRWVVLRGIAYDSEDVWIGSSNAKGRRPVRVALELRTPQVDAAATAFYLARYRPGSGTFDAFINARQEMMNALHELDRVWSHVVMQFAAGPWTQELNSRRPGELPSEILRLTLQAYLHEQLF